MELAKKQQNEQKRYDNILQKAGKVAWKQNQSAICEKHTDVVDKMHADDKGFFLNPN